MKPVAVEPPPPPCVWTDTNWNKDKDGDAPATETLNLSCDDPDCVTYKSCAAEKASRQKRADMARAKRYNRELLSKHATGADPKDNICYWTNPVKVDAQKTIINKEVLSQPDDADHPRYESCQQAQQRKYKELGKSLGYYGTPQQIVDQLRSHQDQMRQNMDNEAQGASELAEAAAQKQEKTAKITMAGSATMGSIGSACLATCGPSGVIGCGTCPPPLILSAALGVAGFLMNLDSEESRDIASQYGLAGIADPNSSTSGTPGGPGGPLPDPPGPPPPPGGNTSSTTDDGTTDDGTTSSGPTPQPTDGTSTGVPQTTGLPPTPRLTGPRGAGGPLGPRIRLPKPDGRLSPRTTKELQDMLKAKGLDFDPNKRQITLPDGTAFSADDINTPMMQKYAKTPAGMAAKAKLDAIAAQMDKAYGDDMGFASSGDEDAGGGGGGGGWQGYDGAGDTGGGSKRRMASRNPNSHKKNKDKSKLAGMSVKAGKDRVGVGQDSIFAMIHRRYQAKRKRQHFIEGKAF